MIHSFKALVITIYTIVDEIYQRVAGTWTDAEESDKNR